MLLRFASFVFLCVLALSPVRAADQAGRAVPSAPRTAGDSGPYLKPNDVIALIGGEDMVAASEFGYLELLLQRALPEHRLKVRCLAWEGDTVFEQPRDLNYPSLEAQLDEIGATVVIMQFGQMESLAGTSKLPEFIKAYEKLIERVSAKRRVWLVPPPNELAPLSLDKEKVERSGPPFAADRDAYATAVNELVERHSLGMPFLGTEHNRGEVTHDQIHLNRAGHSSVGAVVASLIGGPAASLNPRIESALKTKVARSLKSEDIWTSEDEQLRQLIAAKNRLWFHYYRPQNWAFLNGDRTEQPSSRDHKDPSKRWFPEEMKQWLPLIEAKEKEIWALAAKASAK